MAKKITETHLHFVGIGGIGMSGIAEVFANQGCKVSGSDIAESENTAKLASKGITIRIGHRAENIQNPSVVIISSAVRPNNPEIGEARRLRIPVVPRAEMLGELMRGKIGIAVGGTHGKTTTTSLLACILGHAKYDPTIVVGGIVDSLGGNSKLGLGDYVVAEADESDGSFLQLPSTYSVITNIDNDHLDHYQNISAIEDAFVNFISRVPYYGLAAVCGDDEGVRRCLARFTKPFVTYGFGEESDWVAKNISLVGMGSEFDVYEKRTGVLHGKIKLGIPGRHNILNAMAAIAIARELEVEFSVIEEALKQFNGVNRRFQIRWKNEAKNQVIVDDYGHHPTEVRATLAAARAFWKGRIITVFQPHRYSRTQICMEEFSKSFADTDVLIVTSIYAASEEPIEGVTSDALIARIRANSKVDSESVANLDDAVSAVLRRMRADDLVICLGAGSVMRLPEMLISKVK